MVPLETKSEIDYGKSSVHPSKALPTVSPYCRPDASSRGALAMKFIFIDVHFMPGVRIRLSEQCCLPKRKFNRF